MASLPDKLLLLVFDRLSFNELRPALGTCTHWRTLAQRSSAFWADIQTPTRFPTDRSTTPASLDIASALACRRIQTTAGRGFALRLYGTFPDVLDATASHMSHIEHLDIQLGPLDDPVALFDVLKNVSAPRIHALAISLSSLHTLPADLFSGTVCPMLTHLCLNEVLLPTSAPLLCFSRVEDVRYWHSSNLVSPSAPDVFAHFPSMRSLSLSGYAREDPAHRDDQRVVFHRFQTADVSRLLNVYLRDECWELADNLAWPLEDVAHITIDCVRRKFLPALPQKLHGAHELVIEAPAGMRVLPIVRLGKSDWTFSRGCTAVFSMVVGGHSFDPGLRYDLVVGRQVWGAIQSATLPASSLWDPSMSILEAAPKLKTLRLIVGKTLEVLPMAFADERRQRLRCPKLKTLVLRSAYDATGPAQIGYDNVVQFAAGDLHEDVFPLRLRLENVELFGLPSAKFLTYFNDVQAQSPEIWRYIAVREMLIRNDYWPGLPANAPRGDVVTEPPASSGVRSRLREIRCAVVCFSGLFLFISWLLFHYRRS